MRGSVVALAFTSFTSTAVYALCFPSLAPFLKELDPSAQDCDCNRFLGVAVAVFSLAKAVVAPLTGYCVGAIGARTTMLCARGTRTGQPERCAYAPSAAKNHCTRD